MSFSGPTFAVNTVKLLRSTHYFVDKQAMVRKLAHLIALAIFNMLTICGLTTLTYAGPLPVHLVKSCPASFQNLMTVTEQNAVLDDLIEIERELNSFRENVLPKIHDGPTRSAFEDVSAEYEAFSNRILDQEDFSNVRTGLDELRERVRELSRHRWLGERIQNASHQTTFSQIMEMPQLIKRDVVYDVPQPCCIAGQREANQMSVSFSDEIVDYFKKDTDGAHRFLRAIQKGYTANHAGSGIRRFAEYGKLVEIKLVHTKGNYRLLGCREANGLVRVLKFMEKRHHNASDMKPFAHLCE